MNKLIMLGALVFVGAGVWSVGSSLSGDALAMGAGVLFGILAGLPTALLVLVATRRNDDDSRPRRDEATHKELYQLRADNERLRAEMDAQVRLFAATARATAPTTWRVLE